MLFTPLGHTCLLSYLLFLGNLFALSIIKNKPRVSLRALSSSKSDSSHEIKKAIICGSGPVGLSAGIMLARNGYTDIKIFDQLIEPARPDDMNYWGRFRSERSYNIGITGRGILSLTDLECWSENVAPFTAETYGSVVWTPQSKLDKPSLSKQERRYGTRCIERDRLTGCLLDVIRNKYSHIISVEFNTKCVDVKWQNAGTENEYCTVTLQRKSPSNEQVLLSLNTSFLIGADGSNSVIRDSLVNMNETTGIYNRRYADANEYVYRTIPIQFPRDIIRGFCPDTKDMSYSMRANDGFNLEALPTKEGVHLGVVLFKPTNPIMKNITTYNDTYQFFQKYFPMALPYIPKEGLDRFAIVENSKFQQFSYVYPKLHFSRSTVLLGDCIHTVKPFFGLGVNSGLEDVFVLQKSLQKYNNSNSQTLASSLSDFSDIRSKEAKALVEISQRFDRGILYFLVPLLVDRFFQKLLPNIFEGSIISMFSDETKSFTQTLKRKSWERVLQFAMITSSFLVMSKLFTEIVTNLYTKVLFRLATYFMARV